MFVKFMRSTCTGSIAFILIVGAYVQYAAAFPPAPTFTVHGVARDSFGWALKASDRATVVIKRNGTVVTEAPISDDRVAENFRAMVPMDTNTTDPYRIEAQAAGASFTVEVRFPSTTMYVTSLKTGQRTIGQPGEMLYLDFTVGADSDGDGIPDTWEWWQLAEMGIGSGDPRWSLATLGNGDFDGDGVSDHTEYLAGTFAFLKDDTFSLTVDGFEENGTVRLRTLFVVDKTYRIEFSDDLKSWSTLPIRVGQPEAAVVTNFTASDTYESALYAQPAPGGKRIYRMKLLR